MEYVLREKIRIGISACNDGAKVRWNRRGWDRINGLGRERDLYVWTPVCPEVMSGLGVPRAPVRLSGGNGDNFWAGAARVKNRLGVDLSDPLRQGASSALDVLKLARVDAFGFMEGSPTCGVYRTTLKDRRLGKPPGVFGSLLLRENIFLFPAVDLESPWKWWDWKRRLHAYVWLKKAPVTGKKELYDIWHVLKFICQEVDVAQANAIGQLIASASKRIDEGFVESWRRKVLDLIRRPSQIRRITQIMTKHAAHYRKHFSPDGQRPSLFSPDQGKKRIIDEIEAWERKAFKEGYHFAGHPINYQPDLR